MNSKKFSEAMNEMDNKYIEEIFQYKKRARKPAWIKWGAMAACLCLLVGGAVMYQSLNAPSRPGAGPGVQPGGSVSETVDPIISSLAVYPASEKIQDVENATMKEVDQTAAYAMTDLGSYLPTQLPDGYTFGNASVYETTMKNGTKYYMLRVTYLSGTIPIPTFNDVGEAAVGKTTGKSFAVFVMNYEPGTHREIHDAADISESTLEQSMVDGTFHISYGDIYVGITPDGSQTARDMLSIIQSINK